jgi:hypothetical protein
MSAADQPDPIPSHGRRVTPSLTVRGAELRRAPESQFYGERLPEELGRRMTKLLG